MNVRETMEKTRRRRVQRMIDTILAYVVMAGMAAFCWAGARMVQGTQTDTTNTILVVALLVMIAGVIGLNRKEKQR